MKVEFIESYTGSSCSRCCFQEHNITHCEGIPPCTPEERADGKDGYYIEVREVE